VKLINVLILDDDPVDDLDTIVEFLALDDQKIF
jgi:hypothetical protein